MEDIIKSMRYTLIALALVCGITHAQERHSASSSKFDEAKRLFELSVDDEEHLAPARALYTRIARSNRSGRGRAVVYLGALDLVEAKHAFWPHNKYALANSGLSKMEKGLKMDPEDIESRFVHAAICHELPFIFGCGDDVERDFTVIASLLDKPSSPCSDVILNDMQHFFEHEGEDALSGNEKTRILDLIAKRRAKTGRSTQ